MASDNIDHLRPHILTWASAGFACNRRYDLDRPQLRYPKTICMVWVSPTINKIIYPYAWRHLHDKSDNTLEAIGGFWIDGVEGDLKPQQDEKLFDKFPIPLRYNEVTFDSKYKNFKKRLDKGKEPIPDRAQEIPW